MINNKDTIINNNNAGMIKLADDESKQKIFEIE